MTNNPREQAVKALGEIAAKTDKENYKEGDGDCYEHIAEAILNALNIEIVSKESKPQVGDVVVKITGSMFRVDMIQGEDYFSKIFAGYRWLGYSSWSAFIIRRNNNPVQYVENIGVKL